MTFKVKDGISIAGTTFVDGSRNITIGTLNGNTPIHSGNYSSYAAPSSHTHDYLPLSGGTIAGQLNVNNAGSATAVMRLWSAGSTIWNVGVGDSSGTNFNISADFGSLLINKSSGNVTTPGQYYAGSSNLVLHAGNYNSYSPTLTGGGASGTWAIKARSLNAVRTSNTNFNDLSTALDTFTAGTNYIPSGGAYNQPADGDHHYLSWGGIEGAAVWGAQIDVNFYDDRVWFRRQHGANWQAWRQFIHDGNYNSYAPTLTGGGASGSWGINVTGTSSNITAYTINQNLGTGNQVTFDSVVTGNNGNGTNFRLGDDAWIGDVNIANTTRLQGVQSAASGYLIFGNGDNTALGRAGTGALTYGGNTILTAANYSSYALPLSGGTVTGNTTIGRDLYISGQAGGSFGNRLIVGNTSTSFTLEDTNVRPVIQVHGPYPVLSLNHTANTNTSHGPTVQFTANGAGRQFVIGMNGTGTQLDIGVSNSTQTNWNPHNGIDNLNGITGWRMDTSGNVYNYVSNRAPIFYDSNNTGYYLDPASGSFLNAVSIASSGLIMGRSYTGNAIWWNGDSANDTSHVLWNSYYGDSPTTRGAAGSGFDGMRWHTYNGIIIKGGPGGPWDLLNTVVEGSSGSNTHVVKLYAYNAIQLATANGYAYASNSMRAPIFYDNNDTSRYIDPNGKSYLASMNINGASWISFNNEEGSWGIKTRNADNTSYLGTQLKNQIFCGGGVSEGLSVGGNGTGGASMEVNNAGNMWVKADVRAPIYYDLNNTAYYTDPASTSVLDSISLNGVSSNAAIGKVHSGSDFTAGTLVQTNIWAADWAGASFVLECTGKSYSTLPPFSFMVQGYLYADTIINCSAINHGTPISYVRVFNYNNYLCFWWPRWGYWNSFEVRVRDAGGDSRNRVTNISDSGLPSGSKMVTANLFNTPMYGYNQGGDLYASAYYDTADTGRYLDPASTSNLTTVKANYFCGNDGNAYGIYKGYDNNNHFIGIRCVVGGTTTNPTFTGQHSMTFVEYAEANDTTGWFFRTSQTGNYDVVSRITRSYSHFNSSVRSPLFYDSDDTSYYVDPNSTSQSASRIRGGALHGPNPTWGTYLLVGGDGRNGYIDSTSTASICSTNGNLHIDAASGFDTFINFYDGGTVNFGNGASGIASTINTDGSHRATIFYDYNNTGYYLNPNGASVLGGVNSYPLTVYKASGVNTVCTLFENTAGDNSWGIVSEFRVGGAPGTDSPSILFSQGYNANTWSVGFGYADTGTFRINRDHGHRNGGWGTTLMAMDRSGNVTFSGNVTAYSDERLKTNIKKIDNALGIVRQLDGVTFDYIEDGRAGLGVIAQQVEKVLPMLVSESTSSNGQTYKNVAYGNMVGVLIEVAKEQDREMVDLKLQLQKQQSEIDTLKALVEKLLAK